MNMDISTYPLKEILVLIMGPIFQVVAYLLLCKYTNYDSLLRYYHYGILLFNLLPIVPLDGGRLLNIILGLVIPYKKSLYISVFISYIFVVIILFSNSQMSISMIVTYIVLISLIHKEEVKMDIYFHKYILERLLKRIKYNRIRFISSEKDMYRYCQNVFKYKGNLIEEKEYLRQKYLT